MKTKIGTKAYPIDNSYSFTIGTKENPYLAGMSGFGFPAKRVTIVSEPYQMEHITFLTNKKISEFVTVSYNRKCHVVLNQFTDKLK